MTLFVWLHGPCKLPLNARDSLTYYIQVKCVKESSLGSVNVCNSREW